MTPTHLIMVVNRDTHELKLVSAHDGKEAEAAFENMAAILASTPNDVHKVTVPSDCGFVIGEIVSSHGVAAAAPASVPQHPRSVPTIAAVLAKPKNGITRNPAGEYVKKLPDGSEIISDSSDAFDGEEAYS